MASSLSPTAWVASAVVLLLPAVPSGARPADPPAASELLAALVETYAAPTGYRDRGEIEMHTPGREELRRLTFETVASPEGLRFVLREADRTRAIWGSAGDCRVYDSARGQTRPGSSLAGELANLLGAAGLDLLTVPGLLAGTAAAVTGYAGAAVDGPRPCGTAGACWVVELAWPGGGTSQLWVERAAGRVLRVEVETPPPAQRRLVTVHRPLPSGTAPAADELVFEPPAGTATVERFTAGGEEGQPSPAAADVAASDQPAERTLGAAVFGETIEVRLLTFVVRAVDEQGDPIRELRPEDFIVTAGRGRRRLELPVVGADWVEPDTSPSTDRRRPTGLPIFPAGSGGDDLSPPPAGQWVVLFVQSDPYPSRMRGQLKELPAARDLLAALPAGDRVALVSFDSHLKLWQDFTHDRDAVYEALERAVRFGASPSGRRTVGPGLSTRWDSRRAQRVTGPEEALAVTAEALVGLPGEKVVIFLGWGLGRYDGGGVRLGGDYTRAVALLGRARASVFVLDISDSAYHSLESGLRAVAEQTGGSYAKTHTFARRESLRLARTVSGHYRLAVDASSIAGQIEDLAIELRRRGGSVLRRPGATAD